MKTEELKTAFQGCETALNIISDEIGDVNGEATWYPWDPHGLATPENVAEETQTALALAEEQGHSAGTEYRALVRVLTRERITPPAGLEDLTGSDIFLAEGEVLKNEVERVGPISAASSYLHRSARVRVGSAIFSIEETWTSGSGAVGESEIVRED